MSIENPSAEEVKSVIDEKTTFLQTYHITPLEKKVSSIEVNTSKEAIQSICHSCFSQKLKEEEFQNKVGTLFAKKLKEVDFINKVETIAYKKIEAYVKGKLGWAALIWVVSIVASILIEKFFHIF